MGGFQNGRHGILLALASTAAAPENLLVIVADDVGVDRIGAYRVHPDPGRTPTIDRLARRGVRFENAWASPMCSPTRANVLTGRYGFRTGIGDAVSATYSLDTDEWLLPEVLEHASSGAYTSAALGKWHLGNDPMHPLQSGFSLHAGSLANIGDYGQWHKNVNGLVEVTTDYATTDLVDDTLRLLEVVPEPWFLWVAFNASHKPLHAPPDSLHGFDLRGSPDDTPVEHMKAMTEAMDTEIQRLLENLRPGLLERTSVVFLGDNGTHAVATDAPFVPEHAKGTVFEGGVRVPLIIAGPRVRHPGSACRALVNATDLFATLAEMAGVDLGALLPGTTVLDSVSLLPYLEDPHLPSRREWLYAERFFPNGPGPHVLRLRTVRSFRYKLIRFDAPGEAEALFDLERDPWESDDLLQRDLKPAARMAYLDLAGVMAGLSGP